jgi:hypothetical protein
MSCVDPRLADCLIENNVISPLQVAIEVKNYNCCVRVFIYRSILSKIKLKDICLNKLYFYHTSTTDRRNISAESNIKMDKLNFISILDKF